MATNDKITALSPATAFPRGYHRDREDVIRQLPDARWIQPRLLPTPPEAWALAISSRKFAWSITNRPETRFFAVLHPTLCQGLGCYHAFPGRKPPMRSRARGNVWLRWCRFVTRAVRQRCCDRPFVDCPERERSGELGRRHGRQPIQRADHRDVLTSQHMRVDHRRRDVTVTEQLLYGANVRPCGQQMGSKAVTERVRGDVRQHAGCTHRLLQMFGKGAPVQVVAMPPATPRITRKLCRCKQKLPLELLVSCRVLAAQRMRQPHRRLAALQVLCVQHPPRFHQTLQRLDQLNR